jgi:hypothetical protein
VGLAFAVGLLLLLLLLLLLVSAILEFFIDNPSGPSMEPGVDSASNRNEYQEYLLGVKAAGA